jgi:hypothetical protein
MIALLQSSPASPSVAIPTWIIGMVGALFLLLLGIIGYLLRFVLGTFKSVVEKLEKSIADFVKSFQDFKDDAPKEYVTHPFLALVRQELKDDVANGHRRIQETTSRFERELAEHKRECPVRVIRASEM